MKARSTTTVPPAPAPGAAPDGRNGETLRTAGIDVGSSAIKVAVVENPARGDARMLAGTVVRIRRRDPLAVVDDVFADTLRSSGLEKDDLAYVATTGEGELVSFRTGHFYGMTTHARGGIFHDPEVRAVIDIGALHARAVLMDERAKVLSYRMTSQCASGSGQFLENICRYLGVTLEEIGKLSLEADDPEKCSSICAVLAETDVINMVSRGITVPNILRGIHDSMAGRYVRLLTAAGAHGPVLVTGGLAADRGLVQSMKDTIEKKSLDLEIRSHPDSILSGALGAALWGAFRVRRLAKAGSLVESAPSS